MRFRMMVVVVVAMVAGGCTSSSLTEEFCNRADACNALVNSVDECIEDIDSALDKLPSSQRDELKHEVKMCLDHPSCSGFRTCIADLRTDVSPLEPAPTTGTASDGE